MQRRLTKRTSLLNKLQHAPMAISVACLLEAIFYLNGRSDLSIYQSI